MAPGPDETAAALPPFTALLPFAVPPDRIAAIYRQWLGTRLFRPHGINRIARGQLHAVYSPAWLCRATATTDWGMPSEATEPDSAPSGRHVASYPHILISASRGLPADWLSHAGGFDLGQQRPVQPATFRDHPVEIPIVDRVTALTTARQQIETSERAACAGMGAGPATRSSQLQTTVEQLTAELVGLPLWLATFSFHDRPYRCLINGQTGTAHGEAPVSGTKIAVLVGIVILAIVLVLIVTQLYAS